MFRTPLIAIAAAFALSPLASAQAPASTAAEAAADPANYYEADPENLFIFETSQGEILVEMLPGVAPAHLEQFRAIIRSGDYDGTSFHRVIDGFMAQGGDIFALKGRESGLPDIPGEFTFRRDPAQMPMTAIGDAENAMQGYISSFPIVSQAAWLSEMSKDGLVESHVPHCRGIVSTARTNNPDSANSQFFLMLDRAEHLDRGYTAWGRILDGFDVLDAIKKGEPPVNPDVLITATMVADMPEGERPTVYVQRADGPAYAPVLEAANQSGAHVCDLPPIPAIIAR